MRFCFAVFGCSLALAQTCPTPAQLASDLAAGSQAGVIGLAGVNPVNCPETGMTETWTGGKLVFSDSPESPGVHGILYRDTTLPATSGTVYNRLFVYHVNSSSVNRLKFTILIRNLGSASANLTVQKHGAAGPTTSYMYAGKLAFDRWLSSTGCCGVPVAAGATVRLDSTFDSLTAAQNYLLHGIWDYSFSQPHSVTVCALYANEDPLTVCPTLPLLARDVHQRGTFLNADKIYDTAPGVIIDTANGISQFPMAANSMNDSNAAGTDATDGSAVSLFGNYGILYRMHLNMASSDGKNLGFLFNPRAGAWSGAVNTEAAITPGGIFLVPDGAGSISSNTFGAIEGKYNPATVPQAWLQWMPTGGVSLPIRMAAVPY